MNLAVLSSIIALCMAVGMMFLRLKSDKKTYNNLKKLYSRQFL